MSGFKKKLRRFSIILTGLACFLVLLWFMIPYMISTDLIKERFELEISSSIGKPVRFGKTPNITLWPKANIELENIIISDSKIDDEDALLRADIFSADMSIVSAFLGKPSFSNYKLVRPTIHLEIYPDGSSNWLPKTSILSQNLNQNNDIGMQQKPTPFQILTTLIIERQSFNIDDLTIDSGSVLLITNPGSEAERITSINGKIKWAGQDTPLNLDIRAIIRGEEIHLQATNKQPLSFLKGETIDIDVNLTSAMLNIDYKGTIEAIDTIFVKGHLELNTPSVRRALEWSGSDIRPGAALGAVDISAEIISNLKGVKLEDLIIKVGDNRGLGILDFTIIEDAPLRINGTLAFNTLDLDSFLRAFTPLPQSSDEIADTIDTRFLHQLGLDLRLSAQNANFGAVKMLNLAATVKVDKEEATFNIGEAGTYGGQLTSKISISEKGIDGGGEIYISAKDINFNDFFNTIEIDGPLPRGTGSIDLKLFTDHPLWATTVSDIKGNISMNVNNGIIPGLDLNLVEKLAAKREFFNLSDVADGNLDFELSELNADIDSGIARIKNARIITKNQTISFSGIVPFAKSSLAVLGYLNTRANTKETANIHDPQTLVNRPSPLSLFIGGSWPNPVISPPIPQTGF